MVGSNPTEPRQGVAFFDGGFRTPEEAVGRLLTCQVHEVLYGWRGLVVNRLAGLEEAAAVNCRSLRLRLAIEA